MVLPCGVDVDGVDVGVGVDMGVDVGVGVGTDVGVDMGADVGVGVAIDVGVWVIDDFVQPPPLTIPIINTSKSKDVSAIAGLILYASPHHMVVPRLACLCYVVALYNTCEATAKLCLGVTDHDYPA